MPGFKKSLMVFCAVLLTGCRSVDMPLFAHEEAKYTRAYYDVFDTYTELTGYTKTEEEFDRYADTVYDILKTLHQKYDIYHEYEGINNLYTVNQNAGVAPVAVDRDIVDLLLFGRDAYEKSNGAVNIAMGPVLRIWHESRTNALSGEKPALPDADDLRAASLRTDIRDVQIDEQNGTVFLKTKGMSLDVGAIAKGYAVRYALENVRAEGMRAALLNAGGNVAAFGSPPDNADGLWHIGVQDPSDDAGTLLDIISVTDRTVVTSGGYRRFFMVNGQSYHHIIDPRTLYPAVWYAGVTVLHDDSGTADWLSTAAFVLPLEEAKGLVLENGAQAIWVWPDGTVHTTDGYPRFSQKFEKESK